MKNADSTQRVVEEEDEEEAPSLCDLPMLHNSRKEKEAEKVRATEILEEFDFCSLSAKQPEMCAADEVFFQGQILPLRHSVSSEKGLSLHYRRSSSMSVSESMDYYSSRSSSIGSSSHSSGGSSAAAPKPPPKLPKPPQNQFHSHPSPSPRLSTSNRHGTFVNSIHTRNCAKKTSSVRWNIFRLGLVTAPPGIALHDLKTRCPTNNSSNCNNFGSRNSTGSASSLSSSSNKVSQDKKRKPRGFLGGCKCTNDAVDTVSSKVALIKRSASESEIEIQALRMEEDICESMEAMKPQAGKKQLSHHRTFEWLKQLSVDGPSDEA